MFTLKYNILNKVSNINRIIVINAKVDEVIELYHAVHMILA